jgi:iron complex outermembrane receptor protein
MLRKTIVTQTICLLALALQAQQADSLLIWTLPDILISDNRQEFKFSETSRSLEVITPEQIHASPAVSVAELLRNVAGVDIRQRGVHGVQADVSIRGGTFDQTLVLINGVKMTDPQTGHHALNLPIDLENVERIEILKGPAARVYGQNAFAGAINIVTKTPDEKFAQFQVQAGQNGLGGVKFSASLPKSNLKQYISVSKDFAQGYRHNTDYDINNYFYQLQFDYVNTELRFLAGYTEREFGANGFYASPAFTDQFESIQTSLTSLELRHKQRNWTITPRLYWRRNQDEYIFVRRNPSLYRNLHIGNVLGFETHFSHDNSLGFTGLGVDIQGNWLVSNNLGDRRRASAAFFAEHRFLLWDSRIDITPGILFHYFTDFGPFFFPGIDLGLALNHRFRLYGNIGQTYRIPTYTDLYYQDAANVGNPDLKPESALSYEGGIKGNFYAWNFQACYFRRDGRELIDWTKEQEPDPWQPRNFGNVSMSGVEFSTQLQLAAIIPGQRFLHRLHLAYTYIEADLLPHEYQFSRYALDNLRHQLITTLELHLYRRWYLHTVFRFTDRVNLGDYELLDSRLYYEGKKAGFFLEATNLLNQEYTETNLVIMPGRWIRTGVNWQMKW